MKGLGSRAGFRSVSVTTPGKLDVDISARNIEHVKDGFWKVFLSEASEVDKQKMQEVVASAGFSSHMWCLFKT